MRKLLAIVLSSLLVATPAFADRTVYAPVRLAPVATAGTILFGDGTGAAPSMSFSADPDTGIYRVGGNRLGFSTGGAGRVFIDELGWFYVGNAISSSAPLAGTITGTLGSGTNITGGDLRLNGGSGTGSGAGGNVIIRTSAAGGSGSAANGFTERMRITSAGEILAGTSTAQTGSRYVFDGLTNNFRIQGDTEARLLLEDKGVADASTPFGYFQSDGGSLIFGNANRSGTGTAGSTERMRITSGGDVGIGTNSPGARLGVAGSFQLTNSAGTVVLQRCGLGNDSILGTESGTSLLLRTGTTERMRVKADGQVRFIPLAADPASAEAGDVYYNSGTNKLRVYNGTAWVDLH
jgi:hypothetical protein